MALTTRYHLILATVFATLFMGCSKDDNELTPSGASANTAQKNFSAPVNGIGQVRFDFTVTADSAQFVVFCSALRGTFIAMSGPNGLTSHDLLPDLGTEGADRDGFRALPIAVNLPPPGSALVRGDYSLVIQVAPPARGAPFPVKDLDGVLIEKRDGSLAAGTLPVNLVFLGPVQDAEEARGAIGAAVKVAQEILTRGNLALDLLEYNFDGPEIAPDPSAGDQIYEDISNSVRPGVNVVFAVDQQQVGALTSTQFTHVGGVPGPGIPSQKSAVVISLFDVTGGDGTFNTVGAGQTSRYDDEVRLAGEEIAQGIAHYLGLPHLVEIQGARVDFSDPIADTPSCITQIDCQNEAVVRGNFMFPFPLREVINRRPGSSSRPNFNHNQGNQYYPRDRVTPGQALVLQHSVFVN